MKDNGALMAENAPAPFKLERELTLMPSEFQERLSASTRSRKSSAARSVSKRKSQSSKPPALLHSDNLGHLNAFSEELDNGIDLAYQNVETHYHPFKENSNEIDLGGGDKPESTVIELEDGVKFMLDNAYTNYESDNYTIKTPPSNMHIRDLIVPLEDWSSREMIREKKYTVLPSIGSPQSDTSIATSSKFSAATSVLSVNNQLDFGRDRMEQEADFFADFRVNTSKVKPTPRQDPLPPIPHTPGVTPGPDAFVKQNRSGYKKRGRSKDRQKFM